MQSDYNESSHVSYCFWWATDKLNGLWCPHLIHSSTLLHPLTFQYYQTRSKMQVSPSVFPNADGHVIVHLFQVNRQWLRIARFWFCYHMTCASSLPANCCLLGISEQLSQNMMFLKKHLKHTRMTICHMLLPPSISWFYTGVLGLILFQTGQTTGHTFQFKL